MAKEKRPVHKNTKRPAVSPAEKRQSRYLFGCVGMMIYCMPCLSGLLLAYLSGMSAGIFALSLAAVLAGIPVGLAGLHFLSRQQKKRPVRAACRLMTVFLLLHCVLHALCAPFLGGWYALLAPQFFLDLLALSAAAILRPAPTDGAEPPQA